MKAICLLTDIGQVSLKEVKEPFIQADDQVKLKVLEIGICGTDREEIASGKGIAPPGEKELILGHEMLGRVFEVGKNVKNFRPGDLAVVTVRRGCGICPCCIQGDPDMCYSGNYTERGIRGAHGFQAEYVVDHKEHLVKVPHSMRSYAVLCEPMSVVEKAIDQILKIQKARLPDWSTSELKQKQALVAGLGPVGLLACMSLRLKGVKVFGLDIVPPENIRPKILEEIGGTYIDGRKIKLEEVASHYGEMSLIIEAAGVARIAFDLLSCLGTNGAYTIMGVMQEHFSLQVDVGHLVRNIVLKNQLILGSVNAGDKHWKLALQNLKRIEKTWRGIVSKLITSRRPYSQFAELLSNRSEEEIKNVLIWE